MNQSESNAPFFRCPVAADRAQGTLKLGRVCVAATVVDTSIEGFTVTVPRKYVARLRHDRVWTLITADEQSVVHPEWMFHAANGDAQLGLRRIQDVTPQQPIHRRWFTFCGRPKPTTSNRPAVVLGAMIMALIGIICLPGIGDDLGTASVVRGVLRDALQGAGSTLRQFLNS